MNQKRCSACGAWNHRDNTHCSECGEMLDRRKARIEKLKKEGRLPVVLKETPLLEIKPHYPWYLKLLIYIVKPIYWTFFFIASGIMYLIAWIAA
ncbi:MAG: hypothetical protein JJT77_04605 [Crocinitomicaceae bacterium]|nr:hypothetical protein [Crocinitomicaceae bacterium]